ncbi:hypothetical protein JCM11251_000038 [Rhodosporidiobolus azoricus]
MLSERACTSTDVSADTLKWLEDHIDFRSKDAAARQRPFDALLSLWGEPCFQKITLPSAVDTIQTCSRARLSLKLGQSPLFVRSDYGQLLKGLQAAKARRPRGFVLCGQPGQGKTSALDIYTLFCVENKVPFCRHTLGKAYAVLCLNTDIGPRLYEIPVGKLETLVFEVENYFFVDEGPVEAAFPEPKDPQTLTIFATSLNRQRYHALVEALRFRMATIALCSREETLIIPMLASLPPTPPIYPATFSFFKDLELAVPSGYPDEGYSDEVLTSDLATPYIQRDGADFYPPIFRFHVCGPDIRRLLDDIPVEHGETLGDAHLLSIDFSHLFTNADAVSRLIKGKGGVEISRNQREGFKRVLFHTPIPVTSADRRWTLDAPRQKILIHNKYLLDRLVQASSSLELTHQKAVLTALTGTGFLHGLVYKGYVNSWLSKSRTAELVDLQYSADQVSTVERLASLLKHDCVVQEWSPKVDEPAPTALGVHAIVPRRYSTADGLLIAQLGSSAKESHLTSDEGKTLFATPVPTPVPSPGPVGYRPLLDIVFQATVAEKHDVSNRGRVEISKRLNARSGVASRRRIFAFISPTLPGAKSLAKQWAKKGIEGFEVGYFEVH